MSAYLVDDETINRILATLSNQHDDNFNWTCRRVKKKINVNLENLKEVEQLGKSLLLLNIQAVNERYSEDSTGNEALTFRFKPEFLVSNLQAHKSLKCLIYQCSEGSVPKTELYKFLEWLSGDWADSIVTKLPEYEKLEWS